MSESHGARSKASKRRVASEMAARDLDVRSYQYFCHIAYHEAGIKFKEGKESVVSARVAKRLKALGMSSVRTYVRYLNEDKTGTELVHLVDVLTTNFTRFFREPEHFEELGTFVQRRHKRGQRTFTLWCAAASSGEEPYSIAMTLIELQERLDFSFRLLATDISTAALGRARRGSYTSKALETVSRIRRVKYFIRQGGANSDDDVWEVKPELRQHIVFDRLNLSRPPFPMRGPFDAIFCRNVMIYFDNKVRLVLLADVQRLLSRGGLLFVGHAETLTGMETHLQILRPSVYQAEGD